VPLLNALAVSPFEGGETFSDVVHFVHVLVIEPHPQAPDPSPYGGVVQEGPYSSIPQPKSREERRQVAREIEALLEGEQIVLFDELMPPESLDPVWCTYGPAPNSAFLIGRDGRIHAGQLWLDVEAMENEIRSLLGLISP